MELIIKKNNDTLIGTLQGRLDTAASTQFAKDMQPLLDNANMHILLDCAQLEFISSSGLRLLLMLRKETIAKGGDITLKGAIEDVKKVLTITGFYSLFNIED